MPADTPSPTMTNMPNLQGKSPVLPTPGSITFTPIEAAFLTLFGHADLFGGIAPALAEVVDALHAAHQVYGLQRYHEWADGGARLEQRIYALEASGRSELGLPRDATKAPKATRPGAWSRRPSPRSRPAWAGP